MTWRSLLLMSVLGATVLTGSSCAPSSLHSPDVLLERAKLRRDGKKWDEAIGFLGEAIALAPTDPNLYYERALTHAAAGHSEPAIADYDRALELRPNFPQAHNNRAAIMGQLQRFDEAAAVAPGSAEVHVKRGNALERLKRFDEAIACYDRAISLNPAHTQAYLSKGGIYNQQERYSAALECYEEALRTEGRGAK